MCRIKLTRWLPFAVLCGAMLACSRSTDPATALLGAGANAALEADKLVVRERLAQIGKTLLMDSNIFNYYYGPDFKPSLSWRLAVAQNDRGRFLNNQPLTLAYNEGWNGPTNRNLLKVMPEQFRASRGDAPEGHTYFRALMSKDAVIEPPDTFDMLGANREPPIATQPRVKFGRPYAVPDGTALTLFLVEASTAVPWHKHDELDCDPSKPLPKFGGLFPDGFFALNLSGEVLFIPNDVSEATMRALITVNGRETITDERILKQVTR